MPVGIADLQKESAIKCARPTLETAGRAATKQAERNRVTFDHSKTNAFLYQGRQGDQIVLGPDDRFQQESGLIRS